MMLRPHPLLTSKPVAVTIIRVTTDHKFSTLSSLCSTMTSWPWNLKYPRNFCFWSINGNHNTSSAHIWLKGIWSMSNHWGLISEKENKHVQRQVLKWRRASRKLDWEVVRSCITVWFCWLSFIAVSSENVNIQQFCFPNKLKFDISNLVEDVNGETTFLQQFSGK